MTEQEKRHGSSDTDRMVEECPHAWQYEGESFGDRFVRCARCGMVRMAMPWEPVHLVSKELRIRHDNEEGDA